MLVYNEKCSFHEHIYFGQFLCNNAMLDEREFELINIIGAKLGSTQRDLSRYMDLSLGQTNMLIRRLVSKGYIRITQLNKRKVRYLLTPKGIAEKMRKTVKYTLNTINAIGLIKENVKRIVSTLYEEGERLFVILGKSDFALLIEMALRDMGIDDCRLIYIDDISQYKKEGVLLICKENVPTEGIKNCRVVDMIYELAKENVFVNNPAVSPRIDRINAVQDWQVRLEADNGGIYSKQ